MKFALKQFGLIMLLGFALTGFLFAQTAREKGIELYRRGEYREAAHELKAALNNNKNDAELWNYLGLAYLNSEQQEDARKALEKAVKASPQNSIFRSNLAYLYLLTGKTTKCRSEIEKAIRLDPSNANAYYIRGRSYLPEEKFDQAVADASKAIELKPDFALAYVLKADGYFSAFGKKWGKKNDPSDLLDLLENAAAALKACSGDCLKDKDADVVAERLASVEAFRDYSKNRKNKAGEPGDQVAGNRTPIKFLYKAPPRYTDAARMNNITGTVTLAILCGADAQIKHVIVLKGLKYGLSEQAVIAALKIRFEPETIDGKPVPVVMLVQYSFSIY